MAQPFVMDSRIRSMAVFVPALILAVWIASEAASEEFLIPMVATIGFVGLVVFSVFVQSVRFETAALNMLMIGYLVGNRGFADITIAKPLYPGEVVMVAVILAIGARYILTRELPDFSGALARTILIFLILGGVRLASDYQTYRLDAVRDSAMVYYAVYFFFGRQMIKGEESRAVLEKCLKFSLLALVPISIIERVAPELFMSNGMFMTVLYQKDDLVTTFAAVMVFVLYTRPHIFRQRWLRPALIIFYIVFIFAGITRASLAGLAVGSVLLLIAGRRQFLVYPAVAGFLGVTVLAGFSVTFEGSQTTDLNATVDKLYSMVDFTGDHEYSSDVGRLKSDNNRFRRELWQSFVDDTNEASPTFGRGFGYDFMARFEGSASADQGGLRSAHNFYVTLYGRLGIIGTLVLLAITYQVAAAGIRAAVAVRRGEQPFADLAFWCGAWAILTSAVFGVVLEGPVGAIIFWLFLGIGVRAGQSAAEERAWLAAQEPELPEIEPVPRPRLAGAMARAR